MSVLDLARPEIRALAPYSSARMEADGGSVLLNANESPWPAESDAAHGFNRYPDPQPKELIVRLAQLYSVAPENILAARGSDEGIDLLVRAFCRSGIDGVALSPPTFGMYAVSAAVQGAHVLEIPLKRDFSLDANAILQRTDARTKIVFVCSPNNPTGNVVPIDIVERLAAALATRTLVVVDEAYIEFTDGQSAAALLDRYPNICVLRTLSKAHAIAGARVGSVLAHRDVIALLRRILPAYPLPCSSIEAALAALAPVALAATQQRIAALIALREKLSAVLRTSKDIIEIFPSQTNFLLARCVDADAVYDRLLARGVVVRNVSRQHALAGCLRITAGSDDEIGALRQALDVEEPSP